MRKRLNRQSNISFITYRWGESQIPVIIDKHIPPQTVYLVNDINLMEELFFYKNLPFLIRFLLIFFPTHISWKEEERAFKYWKGKKYYL
jgi:hypothetical protein